MSAIKQSGDVTLRDCHYCAGLGAMGGGVEDRHKPSWIARIGYRRCEHCGGTGRVMVEPLPAEVVKAIAEAFKEAPHG